MRFKGRKINPLTKKARRGFRGYPLATVAFYGPDETRASKVAVGIVSQEGAGAEALERWYSEQTDVRFDKAIGEQVLRFIKRHKALTVVTAGRIIGCPHEEGIDYPDGVSCPECPYWAGRSRWTGEMEDESETN